MQLKYVGDMPLISKNGVGFDHTQPDRYKFLHAAIELLEALSYGATKTTQHLYRAEDKDISSDELMLMIHRYVPDINALFKSCDDKAHDLIHDLVNRVKANDALSADEQTAWLENIKIMRAYYYQYIINKNAYEAALEVLGDEINDGKIQEVCAPMFKNYAAVLNDVVGVLERRKAPIDSEVRIEQTPDGLVAKLIMAYS
ncbi:hypothetical protein JHD49_04210 [Sulfurimonas sp. SAG-AH-194-C21]|nr:hypothetical protein [Sulfurimonas sp. SAG-AH-194-C21]MDF1883135.1 hypothetical protein [Sulfurimonas sp. SAG-AH-194-C21]